MTQFVGPCRCLSLCPADLVESDVNWILNLGIGNFSKKRNISQVVNIHYRKELELDKSLFVLTYIQ